MVESSVSRLHILLDAFKALATYINSEQRREAFSPRSDVGGGEPEGCGLEEEEEGGQEESQGLVGVSGH